MYFSSQNLIEKVSFCVLAFGKKHGVYFEPQVKFIFQNCSG